MSGMQGAGEDCCCWVLAAGAYMREVTRELDVGACSKKTPMEPSHLPKKFELHLSRLLETETCQHSLHLPSHNGAFETFRQGQRL